MKRHTSLIKLSREHHRALALAKRARQADGGAIDVQADLALEIAGIFKREIEGHFQAEENSLLPRLDKAGLEIPVKRTLSEHKALRELVAQLAEGEISRLGKFGELLAAHVRFEERELFPLAESVLTTESLDLLDQELS